MAPTAILTAPAANQALSGTVTISGTASDALAFKEYQLEYGAGASPGSWTSLGTYTISDKVMPGEKFSETITKTSAAGLDPSVTPLHTKTISFETRPGPQSISIVGQTQIITRGGKTSRVDTPNARIATVSNLKFEEVTAKNPLKPVPE